MFELMVRAAEACLREGTTAAYLVGPRSLGGRGVLARDVDLVVVLADGMTLAQQTAVADATAAHVLRLRETTQAAQLSLPTLATWSSLRRCWAADPVETGLPFWRHAKLISGTEQRTGSLPEDREAWRRHASAAAAAGLRTAMPAVSGGPGAVTLANSILGFVLRALWIIEGGEWLSCYPVLLDLCAHRFGGALAALRDSVDRYALLQGFMTADRLRFAAAVDQIAHALGAYQLDRFPESTLAEQRLGRLCVSCWREWMNARASIDEGSIMRAVGLLSEAADALRVMGFDATRILAVLEPARNLQALPVAAARSTLLQLWSAAAAELESVANQSSHWRS